jgi:myo-inositol-1(or 4)-monophosphatase
MDTTERRTVHEDRAQGHDRQEPPAPPEPEIRDLMALAGRAAGAAGELIREQRPPQLELRTKSSPTDVVTQMDHEAEAVLRDVLLTSRPRDGLLGEEGGLRTGTSGVTWIVDPIDGTVNYLYDLPGYAVSVAAVVGDPLVPGRWRPVAGCVFAPAVGTTWTAGAGIGSFADGRTLGLGEPPELSRALIGTGFGYRAARRRSQARVLAGLMDRIRDVRRIGSAAMDLCMVADGRLDAFYERGLNPWDMAAGMLLVREARGVVRGLRGAPPSEDFVVAGPARLVESLEAALLPLSPDRDEDPLGSR